MVAENGLGAERVSGCGVVSAWSEDLHPCFVWVLNMLDCFILGSMHIGLEVTNQGFSLVVLDMLMVCEVNELSGVVFALEDPCWPIRVLPFTHTVPQGSHTLSGICAGRAIMSHGS